MDRALIQAAVSGSACRRHSLAKSNLDDRQIDYFLERYQSLRQQARGRHRPQSLDRAYKSAMLNSFSSQTLQGAMLGSGGFAQRRLESLLAARGAGGRGAYSDAYSDT